MKSLKKKGFTYVLIYTVSLLISASVTTTTSYFYVKLQNKNIENFKTYESFMESEINNFENLCKEDRDNYIYKKEIQNNIGLVITVSCQKSEEQIDFNSKICLTENEDMTAKCRDYNGVIPVTPIQ
jgi:hypothetical protein